MTKLLEVQQTKYARDAKRAYDGTTYLDGVEIPIQYSPSVTANQIVRQLERHGMATVNIIGIPGSGKSETATMLSHLIHPRVPECVIKWAGSNELRHIKEYLSELPKGRNYIIIFDDTSNALDALSGEELSDAFLSYTKGRHNVLGKLCIFMIYHYSKSQKKNFRAMALFNVFLSATATEKGNIRELIRGDDVAVGRYKQFQRLFTDAFSNKSFTLHFGKGGHFPCKDSDPFRIAFVLGPMGADIRLTKIMKCSECAEKPVARFVPPEELIQTIEKVYGIAGRMALS